MNNITLEEVQASVAEMASLLVLACWEMTLYSNPQLDVLAWKLSLTLIETLCIVTAWKGLGRISPPTHHRVIRNRKP